MPEPHGDIDYTVHVNQGETTFRANTPQGEEFLGADLVECGGAHLHSGRSRGLNSCWPVA